MTCQNGGQGIRCFMVTLNNASDYRADRLLSD